MWAVIVGSRPISTWFGVGPQMESTEDYLGGSPLDAALFLILIIAGLLVLRRRKANWNAVISKNRWLFLFYLYLGISVLWSDFTFVSSKRWIKDFGNVVMVLVLLTEQDPIEAIKAVFARCAYVLIPLSALFIKYIPDLGRVYDVWTWTPIYVGVTTNKNELGCLVLTCSLVLLWDLIDRHCGKRRITDVGTRLLLLVMCVWLLQVANSATAKTCTILGASLLFALRLKSVRMRLNQLEIYVAGVALLFIFLDTVFDLRGAFFQSLNRDATLTGRTDIWRLVLAANVNPLIGSGFYSFWLGNGSQALVDEGYQHLTQAHNGYLETYLNSGLIGVGLLVLLLASAYRRIRKDLLTGSDYARVMFILFIIGIVYNWTEAAFNRLTPLWLILILALTEPPKLPELRRRRAVGSVSGGTRISETCSLRSVSSDSVA
jgi:O-antigen ligase